MLNLGGEVKPMHTADNRAVYRVGQLGDLCDVEARFRDHVIRGMALDLSDRGVRVALSRADATPDQLPRMGHTAQLTLSSDTWTDPVTIDAIARHRTDPGAEFYVIGFEFVDQPELEDPSLYRLFNRRRSVRVKPRSDQVVAVTLQGSGATATGTMRDISMTGIGIGLHPSVDNDFADHSIVRLEFSLQFGDELRQQATIRSRRMVDQANLIYGLTFQLPSGRLATPPQVQDYVIRRHDENRMSGADVGP